MSVRFRVILSLGAVWLTTGAVLVAAELQTRTIEAFDRYVQVTEARMQTEVEGEQPFLWVDRLADTERDEAYAKLKAGEVVVERLETRAANDKIDIPKGMVHHWVGTVLIPGASLESTIALVRDYERYPEIYGPNVQRASVLSQDGDRFKVYARLHYKKVLTAVHDTEYDAEFVAIDEQKVYVPSRTTSILEVEHPGTPEERHRPEGNDRGLLWRFNNYCSFEARDEGTYMQCESISLTRGLPFLVGQIVRPFITGVPKEVLTFTLTSARERLTTPPSTTTATSTSGSS